MRNFFHRQGKFRPRPSEATQGDHAIPEDLWVKCLKCTELIYSKELDRNARVCPKCSFHFRLGARSRIALIADPGSFTEWDIDIRPNDPLAFVDGQGPYDEKITRTQQKTGETEALVTGRGTVDGRPLVMMVADFDFLGASMGSVWGEKLVRAVERAAETRTPVLSVNASGGARMHEGIFSLMQMAKTVAGFNQLGRAAVPHFSLLVDPCYGGVTASYATVADVILAEPGARIGFAGQRVIEQITKQKLPDGFQTAEFLLEHGMIDLIVDRSLFRQTLVTLIDHHRLPGTERPEPVTTVPLQAPAASNGLRPDDDLVRTAPLPGTSPDVAGSSTSAERRHQLGDNL
jgi:acetyl-CoA carboxylase carboxyl transferase subunit beta